MTAQIYLRSSKPLPSKPASGWCSPKRSSTASAIIPTSANGSERRARLPPRAERKPGSCMECAPRCGVSSRNGFTAARTDASSPVARIEFQSVSQTAPQHLKDCNFTPITPHRGVVTLFDYGSRLSVERGHLILEDRIGPRRRYGRFARVRHGIKRVVAIGSDGSVSLAALRWLADQDAAFIMLERDGKVLATTCPVKPSDARLRRSQSLAHESGIALKIARELISEKLLAQERVIKTYFRESPCSSDIVNARRLVVIAKSNEEIRRWEAKGAKAYWSAM